MLTAYQAAEALLDIDAVTFRPTNPFRYESGLLSPIYVDCRLLPSHPKQRESIADSLTEAFRKSDMQADVVVGTGASAITLAEYVSRRLRLPMAYTRREQKGHGTQQQREGAPVEGRKVLLISDMISTGQDIPSSVEAIRGEGGLISYCQAVFDMELEENDRFLMDHEIEYGSLTTLSDLLVVAEIKKHLTRSDGMLVQEWHSSPTEWDNRRRAKLEGDLLRNRREVAEILVHTKAVQIRTDPPFDYSGGGQGPIYTDNRVLLGHPREREVILDTMADLVVQNVGVQNIDCIGAIATAGISYASGLAAHLDLPMIIVKSSSADHGMRNLIDGVLVKGTRVLLLEDLVNKGTSTIRAAKTVRDAGGAVTTCMTLFTYGLQVARDHFAENQIELISLTDLPSLLKVGVEDGLISRDEQQVVSEWKQDPSGWSHPDSIGATPPHQSPIA